MAFHSSRRGRAKKFEKFWKKEIQQILWWGTLPDHGIRILWFFSDRNGRSNREKGQKGKESDEREEMHFKGRIWEMGRQIQKSWVNGHRRRGSAYIGVNLLMVQPWPLTNPFKFTLFTHPVSPNVVIRQICTIPSPIRRNKKNVVWYYVKSLLLIFFAFWPNSIIFSKLMIKHRAYCIILLNFMIFTHAEGGQWPWFLIAMT